MEETHTISFKLAHAALPQHNSVLVFRLHAVLTLPAKLSAEMLVGVRGYMPLPGIRCGGYTLFKEWRGTEGHCGDPPRMRCFLFALHRVEEVYSNDAEGSIELSGSESDEVTSSTAARENNPPWQYCSRGSGDLHIGHTHGTYCCVLKVFIAYVGRKARWPNPTYRGPTRSRDYPRHVQSGSRGMVALAVATVTRNLLHGLSEQVKIGRYPVFVEIFSRIA